MKRGPKPQPPQPRPSPGGAGRTAGTARAARPARAELPHLGDARRSPIMPDYLANDPAMEPARLVWMENIERVTAYGCHEADSDLFARHCINETIYRAQVTALLAGCDVKPPATSLIESLRKSGELLGLAGPASRQRQPGTAPAMENAFARNGRPPR